MLEAAGHTTEASERAPHRVEVTAQLHRHRGGAGRVLRVMAADHREAQLAERHAVALEHEAGAVGAAHVVDRPVPGALARART